MRMAIDLGVTTYLFLLVNCYLLVLGALRMFVAFCLTVTLFFDFALIKDVTVTPLIGEVMFVALHEYAMFFLGILAGFKNNLRLLYMYELLIVLLSLSKALSLRESVENRNIINEDLGVSLTNMMNDGRFAHAERRIVDEIQLFFHCCGLEGPEFWLMAKNTSTEVLPKSCCKDERLVCNITHSWQMGCTENFRVPSLLFGFHYYTLYPGSEVILFCIGVLLIMYIKKTAGNSLI